MACATAFRVRGNFSRCWPGLYACKLCIAFYAQASERNQRDTNDRERLREKNKSNDPEHTGEKQLMRSEFRLAPQIRRDLCIIYVIYYVRSTRTRVRALQSLRAVSKRGSYF